MWMYHFEYAGTVLEKGWKPGEGKKHAEETIEKFLLK